MNRERGRNAYLIDRLDPTVECVRLHYREKTERGSVAFTPYLTPPIAGPTSSISSMTTRTYTSSGTSSPPTAPLSNFCCPPMDSPGDLRPPTSTSTPSTDRGRLSSWKRATVTWRIGSDRDPSGRVRWRASPERRVPYDSAPMRWPCPDVEGRVTSRNRRDCDADKSKSREAPPDGGASRDLRLFGSHPPLHHADGWLVIKLVQKPFLPGGSRGGDSMRNVSGTQKGLWSRVFSPDRLCAPYFVPMTDPDGRLLVTGAMGCIGAWVVKQALDQGLTVVAMDASTADHRLTLALGDDTNTDRLVRVTSDVTDSESVVGLIEKHDINAIVHLAALQVPAVAAQPIVGARVNVVGMAVILDAIVRCGTRTTLAYASSIAAYDEGDQGGETSGEPSGWPSTLYGVYKRANEGAAHVYSERDGISSIGLRPYVVYGPGRDFGMTSDPTLAMKAVVDSEPFHIRFGGISQMQYVEDVAAAFLAVTMSNYQGATVVNIGGPGVGMEDVIQAMEAVVPATRELITYDDVQLPFPPVVESNLMEVLHVPVQTSIAAGVARTIDRFRWAARTTG